KAGGPANRAPDQHGQGRLMSAAGVAVPRFSLHGMEEDPKSLAATVRYPCVLKPLRLSASRGVIRANEATEFVAAHARLERILAAPEFTGCGEWARQFLV